MYCNSTVVLYALLSLVTTMFYRLAVPYACCAIGCTITIIIKYPNLSHSILQMVTGIVTAETILQKTFEL